MTKILGLDLGTNSIGWAIVDKEGNEFSLVDKGVRIFSEGVKSEKGIESSRAAERTGYRSARKIKFRRKLRKYETLKVLSKNGMCPLSLDEVEAWRKSGFKQYPLNPEFLNWLRTDDVHNINPYVFRDRASKTKVTLYEVGRALYHLAQRRGFLSNRLDQSAEGIIELHAPNIESRIEETTTINDLKIEIQEYFEGLDILDKNAKELDEGEKKLKSLYNALDKIIKANEFEKAKTEIIARLNWKEDQGAVKQEIGEISQAMKDGCFETLGQYFYSLYNKGKIRNHYTAREAHYLNEFEKICEVQKISAIDISENIPEKRYSGLAKELYRAIFFQRPLKSQKGLIGKCSLDKTKSRCAISHPDFEAYRMWSYLNTIKIKTPQEEQLRFLTIEEKQQLIPKFFRKKDNFNFEDLSKELIPKGYTPDFYKSSSAKTASYIFNYKAIDSVAGCVVSASLKNVLGEEWNTKTWTYETKNSKGEFVNREVDYKDLWHLLTVSTSDAYLEEYAIEKLGLDEKRAKSFSKIRLKKDFASLSLSAINKILPYLKQGLLYSHAVFMANIEKIVDENIWNNPEERLYIQNKIAEIIENNTFENSKLEIVNGLIKDSKLNSCYYSLEAEQSYKEDLVKKVNSIFKEIDNKEAIVNDLFPVFIEQLKKYEYISVKRLDEKVLEFLKGENEDGEIYCTNPSKLNKLFHPSDIDVFKKKVIEDEFGNKKVVLGSPLISSIKNPMAMRALHQLRKVLNTLIIEGLVDEKTRVHIELARELNDANKRKAIQDFQKENQTKREEFRKEIKALYLAEINKEIEPTEDDLLRYQLWIEQDKKEIYEEGKNISICDFIGENPKYDIEHTVPRSISQDNSLMNKTLCSQRFNREIKKNKMPIELANHEEIIKRVDHWRIEADKLSWEIEQLSKGIKAAATKDTKDRKIRRRHFLTLKRDYLKGKYSRFVWKEPKVGFKNSQIPDTGIITKYSRAYLNSYFSRVESVKGGMVAEFRKIWGIQESYSKDGKKYYVEKDRSKHTHHTIDAITIACMTKDKYDVLAKAWTDEDNENLPLARKLLADSKPWSTFTEDIKKIEEEILVSHHTPDNVKKQAKKIIRIRGQKQYLAEMTQEENGKKVPQKDENGKIIYKLNTDGKRIPRVQQGDTVRGSLHQDSIYGAIKNPLNPEEIRYVIRKDIESIKATDVENIVDEVVKEKVREAIANKVLLISSNPQQKNKLADNQKVWMNEEKGIAINKVRLYANSVKNPLHIKEHSNLSKSRHEHKQKVYGQNDENYAMAIYELDGKREFELINNFTLAKLQKTGEGFYPLFKEKEVKGKKILYPIAKSNNRDVVLRKGQQVIFYDKALEKPLDISHIDDFTGRIYIIEGLSINRVKSGNNIYEFGVIQLRYFKEARKADDIKKDKYKPDGDFKLGENKPTRKMSPGQFNAFVEGIDFKVLPSGKFEKI
ncbi:CRISPR-associated endonuclease Csn1 [Flavobacterium succinicans]|uniref:CRISPR-associated endonuclease Cas9 n=1 Tax=Flavobacterium succinicans TaxID=29536 RepID=A0A1I4YFQ5_9FLAO|nr:type II CRISPR RNA-guided endonuclease Cas9 [Flavobacterium succinicans]SFN36854.1 CRISPR-associated endonuclease Csn1 [Flavobacterium succinicans]